MRNAIQSVHSAIGVLELAVLAVVVTVAAMTWQSEPDVLANKGEAESALGQELLDYDLVDGTGFATFIFGESVHVDRLKTDRHMGLFQHEWQWTGMWLSQPLTSHPASAAVGEVDGHTVVFGQVTRPDIVTVQLSVNGEWQSYEVTDLGYALIMDADIAIGPTARFLDATGTQLFESAILPG